MDGKKAGNMFMAQGAGTAFQSRAAAVFGALPSANLPEDIPDDLEKSSAPASGQSETGGDVMHSGSLRKHARETYVAPARRHEQADAGGKRRRSTPDGGGDGSAGTKPSDDFEKPPDNLSLPPPRKRRSRGYRPPDHILHPERYTKYSLEESAAGPYAGMSDEEKNKAGVAQLFAEIRRRQRGEEQAEDAGVDKTRVVFRRAAERKTKPGADTGGDDDDASATVAGNNGGDDGRGRANASAAASGGGGHCSDAVLSFDAPGEEAEETALDHGHGVGGGGGGDAGDGSAPVKFSARKKFRGRRRAADDDEEEEEEGKE